jgi:calcineurin-like phosphoesterase
MTSTTAMEAGSTSVERLLAAAVATMEKARYCWAMTPRVTAILGTDMRASGYAA